MSIAQTLYSQLESIIANNPRVAARLKAGEHDTGDAPAVQRASRRRAGHGNTAPTSTLPAANTAGVTS